MKSSISGKQGNCVQVHHLDKHDVMIRDSKDPGGPALYFTAAEFAAFREGCRNGEFDNYGHVHVPRPTSYMRRLGRALAGKD